MQPPAGALHNGGTLGVTAISTHDWLRVRSVRRAARYGSSTFSADSLNIHHALPRPDFSSEDAYNVGQGIANVASRTAVEMLGAKIDAQSARVEASFAELEEELRRQHTLIWTLIAILGAAVGGGLVALIRQIT